MQVGDLVKYISSDRRWDDDYNVALGVVVEPEMQDFHGRKDGSVLVFWNSVGRRTLVARRNLEVINENR
jgi:hypothetical protein